MAHHDDRPILVELTRGNLVESVHAVRVQICDRSGAALAHFAAGETRIFPRSAIKGLQAMPLVLTGGADAFKLDQQALALTCSSHLAEPAHVSCAQSILAAAGLGPGCLECGPQSPRYLADQMAIVESGEKPGAIHNNCSGKHSGFLALGQHLGHAPTGYIEPDHPTQQAITKHLEHVVGVPHDAAIRGRDGCSIPNHAVPMDKLATSFAKFGCGGFAESEFNEAAARLRAACMAAPFFVAGTGEFGTDVMAAANSKIFVKGGAEGVYTGAIPELGLGLTLKCIDGTARATETVVAELLSVVLPAIMDVPSVVKDYAVHDLRNRNNWVIGQMRVEAGSRQRLAAALSA